MPFGWRSVDMSPLRECIAIPDSAPPPLTKSRHGRIVQSHFSVEPPDAPARCAQAYGQFGFLAGDQIIAETPYCLKRTHTNHHNSAKRARLTSGPIPFLVAQPIVDRSIGVALAQPS